MAQSHGIRLKKQYGQHFLRNQQVVEHIVEGVALDSKSSVFEIGCGDGFLTREIIKKPIARLWIYEIDEQWVSYIKGAFTDPRITIYHENFLDISMEPLEQYAPWTILANLPYQVTFPILHKFQANRHLIKEGIVMVQEEVAQKIVKSHGRDYGYTSLFFQHYFTWKLLDKVAPGSFLPPPKVYSRLMHFVPRVHEHAIPQEEQFWGFIKLCFKQPRRTLRNNLTTTRYISCGIPDSTLALRAQQMTMDELLLIWTTYAIK